MNSTVKKKEKERKKERKELECTLPVKTCDYEVSSSCVGFGMAFRKLDSIL